MYTAPRSQLSWFVNIRHANKLKIKLIKQKGTITDTSEWSIEGKLKILANMQKNEKILRGLTDFFGEN